MTFNKHLAFATGLRGINLAAKFLFTVFLAKILTVEDFSHWVLILAIVTYGTLIIGAELYHVTLRTFIADGFDIAKPKLSAQWAYFGVAYAVTIGLSALFAQTGTDKIHAYAVLIALILIFDHASLELHRMSFYRDHQVHANAILLIKSAAWMVPMGAYMVYQPQHASLGLVLSGWLVGAIAATGYGLLTYASVFRHLRPAHLAEFLPRCRHVFRVLAPFSVVAIALRTPAVADRYLLEHFASSAELAAYGYYATFGNGVQAIFDVLILARLIPALLNKRNDPDAQRTMTIRSTRQATVFWLGALAILWFLVPYVNIFVGKESFQTLFPLMPLLFVGQLVSSLAIMLHYALYSMHRDDQLAKGAIIYLCLCLAAFALLIPTYGAFGAATSLLFAALGLLAVRAWQLLRIPIKNHESVAEQPQ